MRTNKKQDDDFNDLIKDELGDALKLPSTLLGIASEYIKDNFAPDDVFDEKQLIDHMVASYMAQDVFPVKDLEIWAESNGYVKE